MTLQVAWLTIIIWSFYPIVWLFSEGFASFSVSFEVQPPPPGAMSPPKCSAHALPSPVSLVSFSLVSFSLTHSLSLSLSLSQVVAYTIMDIIAKCVFSFMIVAAHDALGGSAQAPVQSREYV